MARLVAQLLVFVVLAVGNVPAATDPPAWAGTWFTSLGPATFTCEGTKLTGSFGSDPAARVEGDVSGRTLRLHFVQGDTKGDGTLELATDAAWFEGTWQNQHGGSGRWIGWRSDPAATKGKVASFAGSWRTSWGLMQLEQKGRAVTGGYGAAGRATVTGQVTGRRLELRYRAPYGTGSFWLELRGDAAFGAAEPDGGTASKLIARRVTDIDAKAKPKASAVVTMLAANRLTYHVRVPDGWRPGRRTPAIVFLHGSNMSARPYVESLAAIRDLGSRFTIVGIDGESWQDWSEPDDPRHNYTYVNWMGRSTYQGYPNTDRESPALVAELIESLRKEFGFTKLFVGGHSQGGYLSYFLLMHFPALVDGVFPMSCGLVMQCEPDVFDDAALRTAQRATPLAIVHGRNDPTVPFAQGQAAFRSFEEHGFPAAKLFDGPGSHMFAQLPFVDAIAWLEEQSSDDPEAMLAAAELHIDRDEFRDVTALVLRMRAMTLTAALRARVDALAKRVDEYAEGDVERLVAAIEQDADADWVADFLAYRQQFEFADAARPVMAAYGTLRTAQEPRASTLVAEARAAFGRGDAAAGWQAYERLAATCHASSWYARVRDWLAERR